MLAVIQIDGADVELRSADPEDARAIQYLWREVLAEDLWFIEMAEEHVEDLDAFRRELMTLLSQSHCHVWVAELRGCVIGVARLLGGQLARTRHVASLDLFLAEDVRGLGLGRQMMETLLAYAGKEPTLQRLELSVFSDNTAALRLYDSLGFERESLRRRAIREADGRTRDTIGMVRWV